MKARCGAALRDGKLISQSRNSGQNHLFIFPGVAVLRLLTAKGSYHVRWLLVMDDFCIHYQHIMMPFRRTNQVANTTSDKM